MKVYDSTLYDSVYETEYLRIDQVKFVEDSQYGLLKQSILEYFVSYIMPYNVVSYLGPNLNTLSHIYQV